MISAADSAHKIITSKPIKVAHITLDDMYSRAVIVCIARRPTDFPGL